MLQLLRSEGAGQYYNYFKGFNYLIIIRDNVPFMFSLRQAFKILQIAVTCHSPYT